jgi:hypothetical protein
MLDWLKLVSLYDIVLQALGDDNALRDLRGHLSEGRKNVLAVVCCSSTHFTLWLLVIVVSAVFVLCVGLH